jgi:hypothetical protein
MGFKFKYLASVAALPLLILPLTAERADAFKLVFKRIGEWDHKIYNPFTGNLISTITMPHYRLEEIEIQIPKFSLGDTLFEKGVLADSYLTSLGGGVQPVTETGLDIAFDNTMFPDIPGSGFTTSTNGGTEFKIEFDQPFLDLPEGTMLDVSNYNIIVSTPLDITDPSMVGCNVSNVSDDLFSAECVTVPEPTPNLGILALGILGAASTFKRQLKPSQSTEKETTKVG